MVRSSFVFELFRDLQFTLRRLGRTPLFTLATVVTLALGIGANTAIFSVIDGVLLKPLPYAEPERLVAVWQTAPGVNIKDLNASVADYFTYREESRTFADVGMWAGRSVTVTEGGEPERVDGVSMTFRMLPLLGVRPLAGRDFTEKDNANGSPEVVMLGYGYWQRRFGGDMKVIGRRIQVDGMAREVIGILPKDFWFMDQRSDVVTPMQFDRAKVRLAGYNFQAVARLKPGVTLEAANADVTRMIGVEMDRFPPPPGFSLQMMRDARLGPNVKPLREDLLGDTGNSLWVVMATIGIVLLIACANVANLLLVRAEGRAQELAVRAALGASRGRVVRELLLESLVLALAGGTVGVVFAVGVLQVVLGMTPGRIPRLELVTVDGTAMLFTLVVSVLAGLAFGAIPAWKHSGAGLAGALRGGGRNASSGRERNMARNLLTVAQVALALVLLVGSGLMLRTFQSMRQVDPGFRAPETLQTLRVTIPRNKEQKEDELRRVEQRMVERMGSIPGVTTASLIVGLPMTNASSQDPIMARDKTYAPDQIPPLRRFVTAAPGTFGTMGTTLAAGREFSWADIQEKRQVAVVSENFAREYWGSAQAALGKQIRDNVTEPWNEIVGVVGDVRHEGVVKPAATTIYWPLRSSNSVTLLVRSARAGTEAFTGELRRAVWEVREGVTVTEMRTMGEVYEKSMARTAFTMTLLGISGGMALLLAAIGIYAVISYTVSQRTREIGIRLALGAQQGALQLLFVRHGLLWGGLGAAVGLVAAAGLSRLMGSILFAVSPVDPLTYGAVAAGLLGATAVASYVPARRVARVDPVEALRAE
jgi:predicted permease